MKQVMIFIFLLCSMYAAAQDSLLDNYLNSFDYFKLRDELETRTNLDKATRLYYTSFADNAFNRNLLAVKRADSFLSIHERRWPMQYLLHMQLMLTDSYNKLYHYKSAAQLSNILQSQSDIENEALANERKIYNALRDVPPQEADMLGVTQVPIRRNEIGLMEIPVKCNETEEQFIFDTGANISTISESYADKLKLHRIPEQIYVASGQGKRVRAELAVADSLYIGNIRFQHVVFIVMPDDDLYFPQINFQIKGIIGFPVISALNEVHISSKGILTIPETYTKRNFQNLALNGATPIIETFAQNDTLLLHFDTGAANCSLFKNYFDKHRREIRENNTSDRKKIMSAGGGRNMKMYNIPSLDLQIGSSPVRLTNVSVYTQYVNNSDKGAISGILGQSSFADFDELIINFKFMFVDIK